MWPWQRSDNGEATRLRELELLVDLYRLGVETQMHFNELILRTRTLAGTGLVVILGGAVVIRNQYPMAGLNLGPFTVSKMTIDLHIPVAAGVALLGLVLVAIVYLLDRGYYMRLLRGATIYVYRIEDFAEKSGLKIAGYGQAFLQARLIRDAIGRPEASVKFVERAYAAIAIVTLIVFLLLLFGDPA